MVIDINFDLVPLLSDIERILEKLRDGVGIHTVIGQALDEIVVSHFEQEGTDEGKWQPLKQSTLKWRRKHGYPDGPILRASWQMFNSRDFVATQTECVYVFRDEKAELHQYGVPAKNIPARPFLVVSAREEQEIYDKVNEYLFG